MTRRISIDPITRLEGHGKIDIFLDEGGCVESTYLRVPEFKGFEKFCEGRAAEEMPTLTQKICGVCPTAHHIASSKALDEVFGVVPPLPGKKIRELVHNAFILENHLLHFFYLAGPDLLLGKDAKVSERHVFGVLRSLGEKFSGELIRVRRRIRGINETVGGSPLYPVFGLPGGVSKPLTRELLKEVREVAGESLVFAGKVLALFHDKVLRDEAFLDLLYDDAFISRTFYMGCVDDRGRLNFYGDKLRVVSPEGIEYACFNARDYLLHLEERVEPWSYMKILYLKRIGWKGFVEGEDSGVYRVGSLARLNASEGLSTPEAQSEYEEMIRALGGKPVHHTLAYHWARLIEALHAAENLRDLSEDEELSEPEVRAFPTRTPGEGVGVCEAPRGTLFHHYKSDEKGIIRDLNLIVATQNNAAAICTSVDKAARALINKVDVGREDLNKVEMAFRAYDPCLACATH